MTNFQALARPGLLAALLSAGLPALASDGHDHGDEAPTAAGSALPRFAAVSEAFELVGVLDGRQLTLYLDRFADNAPVPGAQIELDLAGTQLKAEARKDAGMEGIYEVTLKAPPPPGVMPVTATVNVGSESDLLAGELDLHESHADEAARHEDPWWPAAGWGAGAVLVALVLALVIRSGLASRRARVGGWAAAILILALVAPMAPMAARAGEGHDHGDS
eukprot:gene43737-58289_t